LVFLIVRSSVGRFGSSLCEENLGNG
jgi:hypothetical protein